MNNDILIFNLGIIVANLFAIITNNIHPFVAITIAACSAGINWNLMEQEKRVFLK